MKETFMLIQHTDEPEEFYLIDEFCGYAEATFWRDRLAASHPTFTYEVVWRAIR